jgi:hypothetical protein
LSKGRAAPQYPSMEEIKLEADNCPVAPPRRVTVYTRVLYRACQKMGGVESLARELHVGVDLLHRWLEGEDVPPSRIFLQAVDLVMPPWSAEDEVHAKSIADQRIRKN